jgi:hypothetical protein
VARTRQVGEAQWVQRAHQAVHVVRPRPEVEPARAEVVEQRAQGERLRGGLG